MVFASVKTLLALSLVAVALAAVVKTNETPRQRKTDRLGYERTSVSLPGMQEVPEEEELPPPPRTPTQVPAATVDSRNMQKADEEPKPTEAPAILKALLGDKLLPPGTKKGPFVEDCSKTIPKKLPEMRQAYTARLVPQVILHQCDIYTTKSKYQTQEGSLEKAAADCKVFGRSLIRHYEGDKDYKKWCGDVFVYLTTGDLTEDPEEKKQLEKEQEKIRAELKELRKVYYQEHPTAPPQYPTTSDGRIRPLTGDARQLQKELKSLQKDLGMHSSTFEDDLARLARLDGDFSDEDAKLLDSSLTKLSEGVEHHDSDEDNVLKLEREIKSVRDDIYSRKHEFPTESLDEEMRELQLMRYHQQHGFNDQNADKLSKVLGGLENELHSKPDDDRIVKVVKIGSQSKDVDEDMEPIKTSDGWTVVPNTVSFTSPSNGSVSCCPANCKICGAFLARSRQGRAVSGVGRAVSGVGSVDLFHSLIREFAEHPGAATFEASCLEHVRATLQSSSTSLSLQGECGLYAGSDGEDDDDDDENGKDVSEKFPGLKAHCMRFAKDLEADHLDASTRAAWCQRVHAYLAGANKSDEKKGQYMTEDNGYLTVHHLKQRASANCCPSGCRNCEAM